MQDDEFAVPGALDVVLHPADAQPAARSTAASVFSGAYPEAPRWATTVGPSSPAPSARGVREGLERAVNDIEKELAERLTELEKQGKLLEAQRLRMRTTYDIEMLRQIGSCSGVENYSMHFDGRSPGSPPNTLLDSFTGHARRLPPGRRDRRPGTRPVHALAGGRAFTARIMAKVHRGQARAKAIDRHAGAPRLPGRCLPVL
ncbi:UvrABC system protein B [Streptomyces violaceorubidus]